MQEMLNSFLWQTFITLFVIIDPFAILPVFISLTRHNNVIEKKQIAKKSCLISFVLIIVFAFIGDEILDIMNISEPAFRIAGGFLLFLAALDMVLSNSSKKDTSDSDREDVSVFPLAIPLIAGPGALTSIVILMRQAELLGVVPQVCVIFIMSFVVLLVFLSLLLADRITCLLGKTGINVLTRVFGIILSAVAVQSMITGIKILIQN